MDQDTKFLSDFGHLQLADNFILTGGFQVKLLQKTFQKSEHQLTNTPISGHYFMRKMVYLTFSPSNLQMLHKFYQSK